MHKYPIDALVYVDQDTAFWKVIGQHKTKTGLLMYWLTGVTNNKYLTALEYQLKAVS